MGRRYQAASALYVIVLAGLSLWLGHRRTAFSQYLEGADCLVKQRCGNINVTYPFKLKSEPNCPSFSSYFDLECQRPDDTLLLQNLTDINTEATNLTMRVVKLFNDSLILDGSSLISQMAPLPNGTCLSPDNASGFMLPIFPGPFVFGDDNLFASFGCTMVTVIAADASPNSTISQDSSNSTISQDSAQFSNVDIGGCAALCSGNDEANPVCDGKACCVSNLPNGTAFRLVTFSISLSPLNDSADELSSNTCKENYAVAFHPDYTSVSNHTFRLKINWAIPFLNSASSPNMTNQSRSFPACSKHSNPINVQGVPGYRCACASGFSGDGYALGSQCTDINECQDAYLNECIPGKSTCHNDVEGSYRCKCNHYYNVGDGKKSGSGCKFSPILRTILLSIGGVLLVGLIIAGMVIFAMHWERKIKRKYFLLNGGAQLQDILKKTVGEQDLKNRLFSAEELKAATQNYADHTKIGMGGFGTVYKGVLADGTPIAIKKGKKAGQGDEFLNELRILMQINHKNIVRLLGCCMETHVPLLVYEFVTHGTVRENLDRADPDFRRWAQRLKVARQTAEALAYLHAAASPPILHRDVKSANVLLDGNLDAKVADFGASRLVPAGLQHVSTAVQGTIGYLDPEYFQTLQLTDKSDVYSLGVMLVELITGQKPIDSQTREPGFANLALLFIHHMQEGRGAELVDRACLELSSLQSGVDPILVHSSMMAVADLARQCLALHGVDRPSMSLLADELRYIERILEDAGNEVDIEENTPFLHRKGRAPKQQHFEAGAVVRDDADFFVQSSSGSLSSAAFQLDAPSLGR